MSEQTIQNNLYSTDVSIVDKYTCFSLGATTLRDLYLSKRLNIPALPRTGNKKPDVLILDKVLLMRCDDGTPQKCLNYGSF